MSKNRNLKFEVFEETPRRSGDKPRATLSKSGNIIFNKKFRDAFWENLEGFQVVFKYDRTNQIIGLQTTCNTLHNSYPIREISDGKGLAISARAFLKHYEIPFEKSRSYDVVYSEGDDGMPFILIELKTKQSLLKGGL